MQIEADAPLSPPGKKAPPAPPKIGLMEPSGRPDDQVRLEFEGELSSARVETGLRRQIVRMTIVGTINLSGGVT